MKKYFVVMLYAVTLLCALLVEGITDELHIVVDKNINSVTTNDIKPEYSREQLKAIFQTQYDRWKRARDEYLQGHKTANSIPFLPEYRTLLNMGVSIVPILVDIFEQDNNENNLSSNDRERLHTIFYTITCKSSPTSLKIRNIREEMRYIVKWWREQRVDTPIVLNDLYSKWDVSMKAANANDAYTSLEEIRYMGIEALPFVIEKIKGGDYRLLDFVSKLARDRSIGDNPSVDTVMLWWEKNKDRLTLSDPEPEVTVASPVLTTTDSASTVPMKNVNP